MTETRHTPSAGASVRKAAAAALEALPAILLAAALLMPAVAAFGGRAGGDAATPASGPRPEAAPALVDEIADQGNRALIQIRAESRESLRQSLTLPELP